MCDEVPGLFGQTTNNSSRDYTNPYCWGKNQFNSSFPVSLLAYMSSKGIDPVYLCVDKENDVVHKSISSTALLGMDPLASNTFYNYEAGFSGYEKFYVGNREKIDLVVMDSDTNDNLKGLEIKLTALPDNSTKNFTEDKYSCEIVMRPPTICFLACSLCASYGSSKGRARLHELLCKVPQINHWEEADDVLPHYNKILQAVHAVSNDIYQHQTPLVMQPVWKTMGGKMRLADDCLDMFVWSNLAVIQMCAKQELKRNGSISRFMRTIIWIYRMLFDYSVYGQFDYVRIIKLHSYAFANDKAFALSGTGSYPFLKCPELTHPRISKYEIRNIILGGGQELLSPERRFDAVLVNSPDIFD